MPAAVFVEAGVSADGADDVVSGRRDAFGFLDDEVEGMLRFGGPQFEEAEGAGVTSDGASVAELVFVGNHRWADPMKEVVFDGLAFRMAADGAANAVIVEVELAEGGFVEAAGRIVRRVRGRNARSLEWFRG